MIRFFKGDTDWDGGNTTVVECSIFCFSSRGYNVAKGKTLSEDGPVRGWCRKGSVWRGMAAEVE